MKSIDMSKSVYDICTAYPEAIEVMKEIGFSDITKPGMLQTAGRFMTIPKGAAMKKISLDIIEQIFAKKGFEIIK